MSQNQIIQESFPKGISSSLFSEAQIGELYRILSGNSELSAATIEREMGTALRRLDEGRYILAGDIADLGLGVEELAFIIEHNRYQEKSAAPDEAVPRIDVRGTFGERHLFFISEDVDLSSRVHEDIVGLIGENPSKPFRVFACRIEGPGGESDCRVLYLLSFEKRQCGEGDTGDLPRAVREKAAAEGADLSDEEIRAFLSSGVPGFGRDGAHSYDGIFCALLPWLSARHAGGEDIGIAVDDPDDSGERCVRFCISLERFREHFGTVHRVFERHGLPFIREYAASFTAGGSGYVSLAVHIDAARAGGECEAFLMSELRARLLPLRPVPVSPFEIRDLLRDMAAMDDYRKLGLIDSMLRDRRKEYLVPLAALLSEPGREVREKAFGLLKNYLLNPTPEMKNDYYWCTLKNIYSAATVFFSREKDREPRPLFDDEIIRLIRFKSIRFDDYTEPLTGGHFLFIRMTGDGIGKGGVRAHASHVSFSGEGALSTNMLFKTMGIGIPFYAAGKGGILGDAGFRNAGEEQRREAWRNVFRAYADFLYREAGIGPLTDVPAGDVGVGGAEIGVMFERITENLQADASAVAKDGTAHGRIEAHRLRRHFGVRTEDRELIPRIAGERGLAEEYAAPSITGKPGGHGLALRAGATGRGMVEVLAAQRNYRQFGDASLWRDPARVNEALAADAEYTRIACENIGQLTFAIQGFGKVGASFARLIDEMGSAITMISDASGTVAHHRRIPNIAALSEFCASGNRALRDAPREMLGDAEFIPGNTTLPLTAVVNVVVPSALEDVIVTLDRPERGSVNVKRLACEYVLQGANGPVTCDAEEELAARGIVSFPDILANSGGVLASYCEWLNGLIRLHGYATMHGHGFVHPIVHNMVTALHPNAVADDLRNIDEEAYRRAFRFILRYATIATNDLAREYGISMKTAYLALGIRSAAEEGRLTEKFSHAMERIRDGFAGGYTPAG